ncbi:hypothetical protein LOZ48_006203, partial [Ophidiomyces ophidiicola]
DNWAHSGNQTVYIDANGALRYTSWEEKDIPPGSDVSGFSAGYTEWVPRGSTGIYFRACATSRGKEYRQIFRPADPINVPNCENLACCIRLRLVYAPSSPRYLGKSQDGRLN